VLHELGQAWVVSVVDQNGMGITGTDTSRPGRVRPVPVLGVPEHVLALILPASACSRDRQFHASNAAAGVGMRLPVNGNLVAALPGPRAGRHLKLYARREPSIHVPRSRTWHTRRPDLLRARA